MATLDSITPADPYALSRSRFARGCHQVAHRALSLGLILLLIGVGATAAGKTAGPLLLWAFAAGDVALLGGFLSLVADRRHGLAGRESLTASYLAAAVAIVALGLYFVFRLRGA